MENSDTRGEKPAGRRFPEDKLITDTLRIGIAGLNFGITCEDSKILQDLDSAYDMFISQHSSPPAGEIAIHVKLNGMPDTGRMKMIFDSEQSWALFVDEGQYVLSLKPPASHDRPAWIAKFGLESGGVTVYCGEIFMHDCGGRTVVSSPFRYPLDQLLLMYFLTRDEGAIIHAAGIDFNKRAYIFPGCSGAGKSTLSKQFLNCGAGDILSDDRVIVRKVQNAFRAFGTPWPGEAGIAKNSNAELKGIFFLSKGKENIIEELAPQRALELILPVVSIPWYDREITDRLLLFCDTLLSRIPSYVLHFKPDNEITDVFMNFISR
ncbi:MAG: hypothetical protein HZA17_07685 [Nitrospirae bacterium]|nr:hypothetical protein [Nitrospirota bacterium]